jgi:hypothetical protein
MNLEQQMRERIRAFLDGWDSLFELRDWLEDHVQAVHDDNGPAVRQMSGQAWLLIAEYDQDWINEDQVREELRSRLERPNVVHVAPWRQSQDSNAAQAESGSDAGQSRVSSIRNPEGSWASRIFGTRLVTVSG